MNTEKFFWPTFCRAERWSVVAPGFLTRETVQFMLLSVQAQQPLGEATPWDNTLGLPKSQIREQSPVPD